MAKRIASATARYGVLAAAQIAVGAAAVFARFALGGAGALAVSAGRLTIAAAILLVWSALRHAECDEGKARARPVVFAAAGIALAAHFAAWIWSLEYTTVAISTLLVATTPVWTALYDAAFAKQRLSPLACGAIVAGAAGVYLIAGSNRLQPQTPVPGHPLLGALLALAGAIAIAAYFIIVRTVRDAYGTRAIVTRTYTWAAVFLIAAAALAHQAPPPPANTAAWAGIVAMALISQLLGHTALNAALRWFSASAVAISTLVEPIVAALLALAIFAESLSAPALAGGLLVLAAIGAFLREEGRAAPQG
ncbi:MAG: DMT family transporter [Candidatus Baltobacteraceae bacterium]